MWKKRELSRRQAVLSGVGAGACALIGLKGGLAANAAEKVPKRPGVYVNELDAFPNSVVAVPTAVPAFIGYTEKAERNSGSGKKANLTNKPTRISSFAEYVLFFGGTPPTRFKYDDVDPDKIVPVSDTRFFLYQSMRLFFDNGGGPCWIVSVGGYKVDDDLITKSATDFDGAWTALAKEVEPAIVVAPDAVLLEKGDWKTVTTALIQHCAKLKNRFAIVDVFDGDQERSNGKDDVITQFRNSVGSDGLSYAAAYYPWLNTNIIESSDIDYTWLDNGSRKSLVKKLKKSSAQLYADDAKKLDAINAEIEKITADQSENERRNIHQALWVVLPSYKEEMGNLQQAANVLPPSGGMAGVYARVDNTVGVFKAPANTSIASVVSPVLNTTESDREDLNISTDGKAVNAIRTFIGESTLVWGARTLNGNSLDWRYINVRRTIIMLEQSIRFAAEAYVFAPNNAPTWAAVKRMINSFLSNQWKAGALAGSTAEEAFDVEVGLGSTMTGQDISDGYMRVTVKLAVVRPAEFIVVTFQQKMQKS